MWRLTAFICVALIAALERPAFGEALRVTTWNLEWFPSGIADRRDSVVEDRRIREAAAVLRDLNSDVLLLQEIRDWDTCERLTAALQPLTYFVAGCSAFRQGGGIGWQQEAIIAKKPAQAVWSEAWKSRGVVDPPRGFTFAAIRFGNSDVGFYSVHLKSNLTRGNIERDSQLNILKRELAAEQLVAHTGELQRRIMPLIKAVVVGGDFNTNNDQSLFLSEKTFEFLSTAGFKSSFSDNVMLKDRITHPGKGKYLDATFDYIFTKGAASRDTRITPSSVSDHHPVTCEIELESH